MTTAASAQQPVLNGGAHHWGLGMTKPGEPLITIITSTFNAAKDIPWTIESIRRQTYPNIQWIVADGASTDETIELLRQNGDLIDVWFSAPDAGIYDAWNKAVHYARGEWVQFIGAGDELAEPTTLAQMAVHLAKAYPAHDIVYGRLAYISEEKRQLIEEVGMPWEEMKGKWEGYRPALPAHPSVFHHISTLAQFPCFDSSYRIAGDSHFLMRQMKKKDFMYVPLLVDKMAVGGISGRTDSFKSALRESRRASQELGFKLPLSRVLFERFRFFVKTIITQVLGDSNSRRAFDVFRRIQGKRKMWSVE